MNVKVKSIFCMVVIMLIALLAVQWFQPEKFDESKRKSVLINVLLERMELRKLQGNSDKEAFEIEKRQCISDPEYTSKDKDILQGLTFSEIVRYKEKHPAATERAMHNARANFLHDNDK